MSPPRLEQCRERDRQDPLASWRQLFDLPAGPVYLDGNSLGPPPRAARKLVDRVLSEQWAGRLIGGWNEGWLDQPRRLGDSIGRLIGAGPGQVIVADSTSVNLYKLLAAALGAAGDRRAIVTEAGNFPTDVYVAGALAAELRQVPRQGLAAALDPSVAVLLLTHVDYRTGHMHDMAALTRAAHDAGALVLWDLAHSAGAVPVDLDGCGADLAVGCGYKFLNGGPGAPAFLYVASALQASGVLASPIPGWFGHARPFDFAPRYEPAPGVERFQAGTPPIVALAALQAALEVWDRADLAAVRGKSLAMSDLLIEMLDDLGADVVTPREHPARGSQVSLRHPRAGRLARALIERGVIVDHRPPDIVRFGITPLYSGFEDLGRAAQALGDLLRSRDYEAERFGVAVQVP